METPNECELNATNLMRIRVETLMQGKDINPLIAARLRLAAKHAYLANQAARSAYRLALTDDEFALCEFVNDATWQLGVEICGVK